MNETSLEFIGGSCRISSPSSGSPANKATRSPSDSTRSKQDSPSSKLASADWRLASAPSKPAWALSRLHSKPVSTQSLRSSTVDPSPGWRKKTDNWRAMASQQATGVLNVASHEPPS